MDQVAEEQVYPVQLENFRSWTAPAVDSDELRVYVSADDRGFKGAGPRRSFHAVVGEDGVIAWHPHIQGGMTEPFLRIGSGFAFVKGREFMKVLVEALAAEFAPPDELRRLRREKIQNEAILAERERIIDKLLHTVV